MIVVVRAARDSPALTPLNLTVVSKLESPTLRSFAFVFQFTFPFHLIRILIGKNPSDHIIYRKKMVSPENPNWLLDYPFNDDISVPGGDFPAPVTGFNWPPHPLNVSTSLSMEVDVCFEDSVGNKETGSRKRGRSETCDASGSKACREKMRRDRLNDKFLELGSILNPGRPPKMDKVAILSDAVRALTLLKSEAQKLKNTNESLQNKIKELKVEKNELRDEKQRLKLEKENLEKQIRASNVQPSFLPHPAAAAFTSQARSAGDKLMPFVGYPGVAMWQFMPPAALDTSQDHVLRPPVA